MISVVTISFNQRPFLRECINSVLSQEGIDLQYILVDAGSTDGSRDLIASYGNRLETVFEPDEGPPDGLNRGFRMADRQIFFYLNSDDVLLPGALKRVACWFERKPEIDVLLGHGFMIDEKSRRLKRIFSSNWSTYGYALGTTNAVQQATFFRRRAFRQAGGFNPRNRTCWDGELLVDMALIGGRFRTVHQYFGSFRSHSNSISGSGRLSDEYKEDRSRIVRKIMGRAPDWREALLYPIYWLGKHLHDPRASGWRALYLLNRAWTQRPSGEG